MFWIASGKSANSVVICAGVLRWHSVLRPSSSPAASRCGVVTDAGEDVEDVAAPRLRVLDAIGGDERDAIGPRQFDQAFR